MQARRRFLYEIGDLAYEMDKAEIIGPIHWRGKTLMVNYMTINGEQERVGGQWTGFPNCRRCGAILGTNFGTNGLFSLVMYFLHKRLIYNFLCAVQLSRKYRF